MASFDEFIASLEADYGLQGKGKPFEYFCKWFLENDPSWSKLVTDVWTWDDFPDKWQTKDLGTDIVFRDVQGQIWAVQTKCFDPNYSTTKQDMDSFLSDSGRVQVHKRLWMQSTNKMASNARTVLKDQDKPVVLFMLDDFRDAEIEYPSSFADLVRATPKAKPVPDHHQSVAMSDVVRGFEVEDRGQLIMACGTGKTFTTLWIKEKLKAEKVLVLLPSLSLLSQTMREWCWAASTDFGVLNVCSDKSVGRQPEDMSSLEAPFQVTSSAKEIKDFLSSEGSKVVFSTYQSSPLVSEAQYFDGVPAFDLVIADEAHRCTGKTASGFSSVLDDQKIRAKKRLFTTATPRFFGNQAQKKADQLGHELVGMDDKERFGPIFHNLTFGEAIRYKPEPLLNDYQVVIIGVDKPMIKQWIENYEIIELSPDKELDAQSLAAQIGLIKAISDYNLSRVISFHSRVLSAKNFCISFEEVLASIVDEHKPSGSILVQHVSGKMKTADRRQAVRKFKELVDHDIGIITNARCLSEGVDVPSLNGIAFIDPKESQIDIIQSVGRAIRKVRGAKEQTKGTIVLPVFVGDEIDPFSEINKSNFKSIWAILKALRAHDDDLAVVLDQYRTDLAKNRNTNKRPISDKIIFDLPQKLEHTFSDSLRTMLVEATTETWEFWFGLLEVFVEREHHAIVPTEHYEGEYFLGSWVTNQRVNYKIGRLHPNKVNRLERVNGWVWDINEFQWRRKYDELLKYVNTTGSSRFFKKRKNQLDKLTELVEWCGRQRDSYRQGKLSTDRIKLLEALSDWSWDPYEDDFWLGVQKCREYLKLNQHLNPKTSSADPELMECGFNIGTFVSVARGQKERMRKNNPDRYDALDEIEGWIWDVEDYNWNANFNILVRFHREFGHARPAAKEIFEEFRIGGWVREQRMRRSVMSADRIAKLEGLTRWSWDPHFDDQLEKLTALNSFIDKYGIAALRQHTEYNDIKIGKFAHNCRMSKKGKSRKRINPEIEARLEKIAGWTW